MQTDLKGELRSELQSILEQYLRQSSAATTLVLQCDKGKGILGGQPSSVSANEPIMVLPVSEMEPFGLSCQSQQVEIVRKGFRIECPRFDRGDFRGEFMYAAWNITGGSRVYNRSSGL
ncbi:hypothetical protein PVK06_043677 [Gossypium arboreum]|uniref:Uncharacterized protein n=1 Tax=Gossypium arboreum TaxID=29729 RepID=A0ABR0MP48_GOSAR|nr:hypothetical protein PVK06_043677 [Gossypium arboreum]